MSVIVPVGDATATFVFNCSGITKDITWSVGLTENIGGPIDAAAAAEHLYEQATFSSAGPYEDNWMASTWTFVGVSVALMTVSGPLASQFFDPLTGTETGKALPVNCTFLLNKQSALGGRKNRGRAYLPPTFPTEDLVDGAGVIGSSTVGLMQTKFDFLYAGLTESDYLPVIHHSDGSAGTLITGLQFGSTIATQRRRLR